MIEAGCNVADAHEPDADNTDNKALNILRGKHYAIFQISNTPDTGMGSREHQYDATGRIC
jgi:hypothetical protein